MMSLEESIRFHTEEARKLELYPEINKLIFGIEGYERAKEEHTQTAEWLTELAERRKQPEIIYCKDCKHYYPDVWGSELGIDGIYGNNCCP